MAITVDNWHSVPDHNQPPLVFATDLSVPRNPCFINNDARSKRTSTAAPRAPCS